MIGVDPMDDVDMAGTPVKPVKTETYEHMVRMAIVVDMLMTCRADHDIIREVLLTATPGTFTTMVIKAAARSILNRFDVDSEITKSRHSMMEKLISALAR